VSLFEIGTTLGMIATLFITFLIAKEILKSIQESKEGKQSKRCDLD